MDKIENQTAGQVLGNLGVAQPYIVLNNYTIGSNLIKSFEIDLTQRIPECDIVIKTLSGTFLASAFPKDGDVISIYMRSEHSILKPVRIDFLITHISSNPSSDPEGNNITFFIEGILNIPTYRCELSKMIKNATSYEALMSIATELGLGFVSNEDVRNMNDKQNWIVAYQSYEEWINSVVQHAWRDDKNFYDWWIDMHYNLTFANINSILSIQDEFSSREGLTKHFFKNGDDDQDQIHRVEKIMLTNNASNKDKNDYFTSFEILNDSGIKSSLNGYRRICYYYDKSKRTLVIKDIEPSVTADAEKDKVIMRGRANEDFYIKQKKYKFSGIQSKNVHDNWKLAEMYNHQNLSTYDKMNIVLHLRDVNLNIYRGQVVPVYFLNTYNEEAIKHSAKVEDRPEEIGFTLNRFLTGNYMIKGMKIKWIRDLKEVSSIGYFEQDVFITRREWSVPDKVIETKE